MINGILNYNLKLFDKNCWEKKLIARASKIKDAQA